MRMNCEFERTIWPPQRLARMRCERGSVFVVLPAGSLFVTNDGGNREYYRHGHTPRSRRGCIVA